MLPLQLLPLHGVGTRHDLPLPFSLVVIGASVVLVVTFIAAVRLWREPKWEHSSGVAMHGLTRFVDHPVTIWVGRGLVFALAVLGMIALWFGVDMVRNPYPGLLFVWVWVGLVPISLLFGAVWRRLSPIRVLLAWRGALTTGGPLPRWGLWPGAFALAMFGFLELVQPDRTHLEVLRWWFIGWLAWVVVGTVAFGARWIASADPFEVYASLVARVSPWQRIPTPQGSIIHLVNPLRHLASVKPHRGTWAVGCTLLGITAFDSFGSSAGWTQWVQAGNRSAAWWGTLGLFGMIVAVFALYGFSAWAVEQRAEPGHTTLVNRLGVSLVPIAVGYTIAHYASFLILEGQRVAINLSDPLGQGHDWFGTATLGVNAQIFEHPSLMAWNQVIWIVIGHVIGVLVAHDLAIRWLPADGADGQGQRRSGHPRTWGQAPLLLAMVVITCAGLLLLFAN